MDPGYLPFDKRYMIAFFASWGVAFVMLCLYRTYARNSKLTISEIFKQKTITISNLNKIFIAPFCGRLTIGKHSFPLMRSTENYRNMFNHHMATIINEINIGSVFKGTVHQFYDKEQGTNHYSEILLYLVPGIIVAYFAGGDYPLYIKVLVPLLFTIPIVLEGSGRWKYVNDEIKYKRFFKYRTIELSEVRDFELLIPSMERVFELKIRTALSTYIVRDAKLKRILPIVSLLNSGE